MKHLKVTILSLALAALPTSVAFGQQHIGFSGQNAVDTQVLAQGGTGKKGVPLLDHFDLGFEDNDHHIKSILVIPPTAQEGGLVSFTDSSFNTYRYTLDWLLEVPGLEPLTTSSAQGACGGGKCTAQLQHNQGNNGGIFVLMGFQLRFEGRDHHIDIISIRESNDILTIEFSDKNGDDDFEWYVEFAYVDPQRVMSTATVGGQGTGTDSAATGMSPDVVIAGFHFDFDDDDHHIRDFAVNVRQGHTVSVKYNDKNSDDDFTWLVDLVELN